MYAPSCIQLMNRRGLIVILGIFDVQIIMEEGNVNDLAEYIRSILNYSFDRRSNNAVEVDDSLIKLFRIAQLVIRFLLYCKSYLRKDNAKLKTQLQVSYVYFIAFCSTM